MNSDDHPDAALCWVMLANAELASGRRDLAVGAAQRALEAADRLADVTTQAWALSVVIEVALDASPTNLARGVTKLTALAEGSGAPSLLARAAYYRGLEQMTGADRSDANRAIGFFEEGLGLAQDAGDMFIEFLNLTGAVFAATSIRSAEAPSMSAEVLNRYHDARNWLGIWGVLNLIAGWWAATGRLEAAGVLYGHLEAHHHQPWDAGPHRQLREHGLRQITRAPGGQQWMSRGADLDRDEIVAYTVALLTEQDSSPRPAGD
jgi:hypothetical protein